MIKFLNKFDMMMKNIHIRLLASVRKKGEWGLTDTTLAGICSNDNKFSGLVDSSIMVFY